MPSRCFKFVPLSHTLLPTLKVLYCSSLVTSWSCTLYNASWVADCALVIHDILFIMLGVAGVLVGWWASGVYPMRVLKGTCFVVLCF